MIGHSAQSQPCCGPCAGVNRRYICPQCGGGDIGRQGSCARCLFGTELHRHFGDTELLAPLVADLERSEHPEAVLYWLRREDSGAALLRQLLAGGSELSHELLDTFPGRTAAVHLRQLLVSHGILPERDELIARTEAWMHRLLEEMDPRHRAVLQPYATWVVLRRIRQNARTRALTDSSVTFARERVRCAVAFLRWLDEHDVALEQATQHDVDRWLTAGTTTRLRLIDFLRWTRRCGLSQELTVPAMPEGEPVNFLDEDHHVALLYRCVHDTTMPTDVRAAGALLLLYGAKLTRIARLTHGDVLRSGDQASVALGEDPVVLPPAVEQLLAAQSQRRPRSLSQHTTTPVEQAWMFPGALPGRPTSAHRLRQRLSDHGIDVRPSRNSAVLALAQDLPAPIVSSLLDLHINTAVHWAKRGKRDWADFLAMRRADPIWRP
ncbi:hypothetical protein [Streptacidiphilus sp. P02-A3a]|uniref:hypothetical protein n=1 Tax=Streptacidiphilus sp. P02-A3a TaxID=2704468 RepID=UPI0015FD4DB9|nr:hypothetical protein [Streptacidiphilus sp. P02-A3a]QMU67296.1 hypothetical protein GXP74_02800 [Streptacidiphilus sp. P02-A3a]